MPSYKPNDSMGHKGWDVHPKGSKSASKPVALDKHRGMKKSVRVK